MNRFKREERRDMRSRMRLSAETLMVLDERRRVERNLIIFGSNGLDDIERSVLYSVGVDADRLTERLRPFGKFREALGRISDNSGWRRFLDDFNVEANEKSVSTLLREIGSRLTEREREVLVERFDRGVPLRALALRWGVNVSRVHQVERKALRKLGKEVRDDIR